MSFPDPPPPPYQYLLPPFAGGEHAGFWPPPYLAENADHESQYDFPPPPKRPRNAEKPQNFPLFQPRVNPATVPGSKGTSHIFYKTRICAKFMEGTCRNGDRCTFAHGADDLREPPPNWQELVGEKDRGNGNGGWSDDQRRINRMKICKKFYNGEDCPYGEKCIYLHERPLRPLPNFEDDAFRPRESSAISIGTTGMDARDSNRFFNQSDTIKPVVGGFDNQSRMAFWKTKLCSKWEMGLCPFGEKCHYAHGESELKIAGTRVEAEPVTNSVILPPKPLSASVFSSAPANLVVAALQNDDEEDKKKSKWKSTKKINRIYADWLDDRTPPYCSPNQEEI